MSSDPASRSIYVAGHGGMVGSAIARRLRAAGYENILTASRSELDLTEQAAVRAFFERHRPCWVFLAAARVGGILANSRYPADFLYQNLMIEANLVDSAWRCGSERLLFLGSSCVYPRLSPQPMVEAALLGGPLEPTNEAYAVAKIAGIKLCESYNRQHGTDFRSVMPANLYGPGDNFDLADGHVIPALLRKFDEAKTSGAPSVSVWGSGTPRREFVHVDDMADACLFVMQLDPAVYRSHTQPAISHINVGSGEDLTIAELARTVKDVVGFTGRIDFDPGRPDGAPRKLLGVDRLAALGWRSRIELRAGLEETYAWYCANRGKLRG